jgi:hypothetical protein
VETGVRRSLLAGVAVVAAAAAGLVGINAMAARREARLAQEWTAIDPGSADFRARLPRSGPNAAALELEGAAAELGIDMAPADMPGRARPSEQALAAFRETARSNGDYLSRQILKEDDTIEPPSEATRKFLSEHSTPLAGLESRVMASGPPEWEIDVAKTQESPVPNLLGHLTLQRLLLVRALEEIRAGDHAAALRTLETSWRIAESLRRRPEMITHLIATSFAKLQAGVLRKTEAPPAAWRERLNPFALWRGNKRTLHFEAWCFSQRLGPMNFGRIVPMGRIWANEFSGNLLEVVSELEKQDRCSFSPEKGKQIWEKPIGRTNFIASLVWPNLEGSSCRLFRAQIELEGTQMILAVKQARRDAGGNWPAEVAGLESSICPGSRWVYHPHADGTATVSFGGRFEDWPTSSVMRLPLQFTIRRPAS